MSTTDIKTQVAVAYVVATAAKHANNGSAELCVSDARSCYDRGDMEHAYRRALTSMEHSVGIFHADYLEAKAMEVTA
ncbi:MAG: hypothetical protein QF464_01165 [Myxococcota bacterium]|nr:hypothetical protein [Myxococcota bacterium]